MGKKLRNAIGTLFLVLAIAATQIPVSDVEAVTPSASDFQLNGNTLIKYTGDATSVHVPDTVKTIGPEAFKDDIDLYAVYLPEGVTSIDSGAFSNCTMLSVVDMPDSLRKIDNFAFSNCKSLSDVTLGEKLSELGYGVFAGCESLKDIAVDSDNQYFADEAGVLYNHKKTKLIQALAGSDFSKFIIPATVQEMKPYAFWGCDSARFVELGGSLKTIPGYAFSNCKGLEEITIPASVTSIGSRAFADCVNLKEAVIPSSVTAIQETAFDGCPKLTIVAEEGSYAEEFDKNRDKSDVAAAEYQDTNAREDSAAAAVKPSEDAAAVKPGEDADAEAGGEENGGEAEPEGDTPQEDAPTVYTEIQEMGTTSVVGGRAVVFIDNRTQTVYGNASQGNASQESALHAEKGKEPGAQTIGENAEADSTVSGNMVSGNMSDGNTADGNMSEGGTAEKGGSFPKYTIVGDKIAAQAYYKDEALNHYEFPSGVKAIGEFAFARTGLTDLTIPEGVTSVGYGAFYHCDGLKNVTIPSTLTDLEPYAFEKTAWLENWKNGGSVENFKIVGDGILIAYKGTDGKITVPEGVKQIAAGVFKDHKGITDVSLPNSLRVIGEEAFAGCNNLKSVSGGVKVTDIKDRAFAGCPIATIRIPESVERIGLGAYDQSTCDGVVETNAVVFLGNTLPELSVEKSSQRLSSEKYRSDAFRGVEVAIVGEGMSDFSGTILDTNGYGFHGIIASLLEESKDGAAGVLRPIAITKSADSEKISLPQSIRIYQKPYGFAEAENVPEESASRQQKAEDDKKSIQVQPIGKGLSGNVTAELMGNTEPLLLEVKESADAKAAVLAAYRTIYGEEAEPPMTGYDISLFEQSGQIPITKLGQEKLKITMPVPAGMENGALHVVCTDADGQLEEVAAGLTETKNGMTVTFEAEHFSPYAIYCYESGQGAPIMRKDGGVLTALSRKKDASPDTGDWIHPKWFLATGLLALAMMMFFLQGNAKKTPGIK